MNRPYFRGGARVPGVEPQIPVSTTSEKEDCSSDVTDTNIDAKETNPKSLVKPLEPPSSHHLNAAQGWLGLQDWKSALDELEFIDPVMRSHPDVLAVRCDIYTAAMKWPEVVAVAETLVRLIPDRPSGWVRRSFALHELKRTHQALDLLLPAASKFPEIPTIPYNLACYCAQLGKLEEARRWLQQSYEIGDASELKLAAMNDPDLAPLLSKQPSSDSE